MHSNISEPKQKVKHYVSKNKPSRSLTLV